MDSDERYRLVLNYLNAFDAELDSKKLLVRSAFFESMFEIFDEVVRATVTATGNAKQEALQETVRLIAKVNYTGTTSKKGIVSAMQTALRKTVQISGDML
jgi:hypothetical protein